MKKSTLLATFVFVVVSAGLAVVMSDAAGPPDGLDVNVINTPLSVQGNVTVDNTPLPVVEQNPVTDVTVNNSTDSPVPVTVVDGLHMESGAYRVCGTTNNRINPGGYGFRGMNQECQSKFGNSARMCTVGEAMRTIQGLDIDEEVEAWVQPSNVQYMSMPVTYSPYPNKLCFVLHAISTDAGGLATHRLRCYTEEEYKDIKFPSLDCRAWTAAGNAHDNGAIISLSGSYASFSSMGCHNINRVLCCTPEE